MPQPEGVQLNQSISPLLTNMAMGYLPKLAAPTSQGGMGFIAKRVFPNVSVAAPAGQYNVWPRGAFLRREMKKLSNFEAPPTIGFEISKRNYSVDRYGIGTNYTALDLTNARIGGTSDAKFIAAKNLLVVTQGVLELELQTANLIQTSGNWSIAITGVTSAPNANQVIQWDQAASDPVADIDNLRERMRLATGIPFNTMILPIQVFIALKKNANLIDRIKYGGTMDRPTEITLSQMIGLFGLNIIVPEGVYNTGKEGQADAYSYIYGKNVWLGFVTDMPSAEVPSAGYHFSWNGDTSIGLPVGVAAGEGPNVFGSVKNEEGLFIHRYDTMRPRARWIESELFTTPNVTATDMGLLISSVIA